MEVLLDPGSWDEELMARFEAPGAAEVSIAHSSEKSQLKSNQIMLLFHESVNCVYVDSCARGRLEGGGRWNRVRILSPRGVDCVTVNKQITPLRDSPGKCDELSLPGVCDVNLWGHQVQRQL